MESMTEQVILVAVLATASFARHDVETIIQRSVGASSVDWKSAPDYDSSSVTGNQVGEPRHTKSS